MPCDIACRAASCATCCAAYAVLLREPLKPTRPALDQPMTCPCMSVMLTSVLLKVARMLATPLTMFLEPLALTIFLPARSSASNSAAVGAATAATGAAPSAGLGASAAGPAPSATGAAPFFGALAGAASPSGLAAGLSGDLAAAASGFVPGLPSFFGAGFFFVSSAMGLL